MKVDAIKDGKGNIVISEDSFEMLLGCLDNQKFIGEIPQNGDSLVVGETNYYKTQQDIQDVIDFYNRECRKILHQKYIIDTVDEGYYLQKKYEHQQKITEWTAEDVALVKELFKDTIMISEDVYPDDLLPLDGTEPIMEGTEPVGKDKDGRIYCKPMWTETWLIERPMRSDDEYLTISEDGKKNRPWKAEEIEKINQIFNK